MKDDCRLRMIFGWPKRWECYLSGDANFCDKILSFLLDSLSLKGWQDFQVETID